MFTIWQKKKAVNCFAVIKHQQLRVSDDFMILRKHEKFQIIVKL